MPTVAQWVDSMRDAFGKAEIDEIMRRGVRGEPVFYARENGHQVGTPLQPARGAAWIDEVGNRQGKDYSSASCNETNSKK